MEIVIDDNLIDNGYIEIFKVHRDDDDGWCFSGDGVAIKYDHKKAIEGVTYKIRETKYYFGNDYEMIEEMHITNTYLLSLYNFIRQCTLSFKLINSYSYQGKDTYTDCSDPNRKVDRILPLEKTNGFTFGIILGKFVKGEDNCCVSIESVQDEDYLIIMENKRPISKSPETFFEDGFEIVDDELIIPQINITVNNYNLEEFKALCNVLDTNKSPYTLDVPEYAKDKFLAAKAQYEKENN